MDGTSISRVAERTGFSPSALRFYENAGLITPARTSSGYRRYDEASIATLEFITRAKRLGLSLDEIAELVPLLDQQRCAPVQGRLRDLVADKITDAQQRTADGIALIAQLRQAQSWLEGHTASGACDDRCGCTTDPVTELGRRTAGEPIPASADDRAIVCTLAVDKMPGRLDAWHQTLASGHRCEDIAGGRRIRLPRDTDITSLGQLIADEQGCCPFLTFTLTVAIDEVVLEVTAPPEGLPVVHALVGAHT
jgi:DNA-binding transcriptional MerR regulator